MITITPEVTAAAFTISNIKRGFEQALQHRKRLNANKKNDLILIHTITDEYKIYEYSQVQRITACGIAFTNVSDEIIENYVYVDYTTIKEIKIIRFKTHHTP